MDGRESGSECIKTHLETQLWHTSVYIKWCIRKKEKKEKKKLDDGQSN